MLVVANRADPKTTDKRYKLACPKLNAKFFATTHLPKQYAAAFPTEFVRSFFVPNTWFDFTAGRQTANVAPVTLFSLAGDRNYAANVMEKHPLLSVIGRKAACGFFRFRTKPSEPLLQNIVYDSDFFLLGETDPLYQVVQSYVDKPFQPPASTCIDSFVKLLTVPTSSPWNTCSDLSQYGRFSLLPCMQFLDSFVHIHRYLVPPANKSGIDKLYFMAPRQSRQLGPPQTIQVFLLRFQDLHCEMLILGENGHVRIVCGKESEVGTESLLAKKQLLRQLEIQHFEVNAGRAASFSDSRSKRSFDKLWFDDKVVREWIADHFSQGKVEELQSLPPVKCVLREQKESLWIPASLQFFLDNHPCFNDSFDREEFVSFLQYSHMHQLTREYCKMNHLLFHLQWNKAPHLQGMVIGSFANDSNWKYPHLIKNDDGQEEACVRHDWFVMFTENNLLEFITANELFGDALVNLHSMQIIEPSSGSRGQEKSLDRFLILGLTQEKPIRYLNNDNQWLPVTTDLESKLTLFPMANCGVKKTLFSGQTYKPLMRFYNEDPSLFFSKGHLAIEKSMKRWVLHNKVLVELWSLDLSCLEDNTQTLEWATIKLGELSGFYHYTTKTLYPFRRQSMLHFRFFAIVVRGVTTISEEVRSTLKESWSLKFPLPESTVIIPGSIEPFVLDPNQVFVQVTNRLIEIEASFPVQLLHPIKKQVYLEIHFVGDFFAKEPEQSWLLSYHAEDGFALVHGAGHHLLFTDVNEDMVNVMYSVPLLMDDSLDYCKLECIFHRIMVDPSRGGAVFRRYIPSIHREFGLRFRKVRMLLQGKMVPGFVNFLASLDYMFLAVRAQQLTLPRLMELTHTMFLPNAILGHTNPQSRYFFKKDNYFSTTQAYSALKGQPELISASTRGNVRIWNQKETQLVGIDESLAKARSLLDREKKKEDDEFQEDLARDFVKSWTRKLNTPVFQNITDSLFTDGQKILFSFLENLHREFLSTHLPAEIQRRSSGDLDSNEDPFLIPAVEEALLNACTFTAADLSKNIFLNNLSRIVLGDELDNRSLDTMLLLGKIRHVEIQQCLLLLTGSKDTGDLQARIYFPACGATNFKLINQRFDMMGLNDDVYHQSLPLFAYTGEGNRWNTSNKAYDTEEKMLDLRGGMVRLTERIAQEWAAGGVGASASTSAREWSIGETIMKLFREEEDPCSLSLLSGQDTPFELKWHADVPPFAGVPDAIIDSNTFPFVLGINIRNMSVVVGESPWRFVELQNGCKDWLKKVFCGPDAVRAGVDSSKAWLDENHRVIYNEEDFQMIYLSEKWVCVAGFGKESRDRDPELFASYRESQRYVPVHDIDLMDAATQSEIWSGTAVHHFTLQTVFGYFSLEDFIPDLSSATHFFNMFSSFIVDNDLVIQGPNDYLVVGGFADPTRWKLFEQGTRNQRVFTPDCATATYHHRVVTYRNAFFVKWNGVVVYGSGDPAASSSSKKVGPAKQSGASSSSCTSSSVSQGRTVDSLRSRVHKSGKREQDPNDPPPPPAQKRCAEEDVLLRRRQQPRFGVIPAEEVPVIVWKIARLRPSSWAQGEKNGRYSLQEIKNWPFCVLKMILPNDAVYVRPFEQLNTKSGIHGKCRTNKAYVWQIQAYNFNIDPMKSARENHGVETASYDPFTTVAVSAFCDNPSDIQEYRCNQLICVDDLDIDADTCCTSGIHVFEQRHYVVMMTGDSFGCDVSPMEILRVMFDLDDHDLAEKTRRQRNALRDYLNVANLLSTQEREQRERIFRESVEKSEETRAEEKLRETLELMDLNFEEESMKK